MKDSSIFKAIGRLPYSLSLAVSRRLIASAIPPQRTEVWPRNSFLTENFSPGISDLDLTVFFSKNPTAEELEKTLNRLSSLKKVFPWMGESNLYTPDVLTEILALCNPLELARDPLLSERARTLPSEPSAPEKTVALLRYLESDLKNLALRPKSRKSKWMNHFARAGLPLPPLEGTFPRLIDSLLRGALAPLEMPAQIEAQCRTELQEGFMALFEGSPLHELGPSAARSHFLVHRFCFQELKFENVSPCFESMLVYQVAWELWGLSCQWPLLVRSPSLRSSLKTHLARLEAATATLKLEHPRLKELRFVLEKLQTRLLK